MAAVFDDFGDLALEPIPQLPSPRIELDSNFEGPDPTLPHPTSPPKKTVEVLAFLRLPTGAIASIPLDRALPIGSNDAWGFEDSRCNFHQATLLARSDGLWILAKGETPLVIYPSGGERFPLSEGQKFCLSHGDGFTLIPLVADGFTVILLAQGEGGEQHALPSRTRTSSASASQLTPALSSSPGRAPTRLSAHQRHLKVMRIKEKRNSERLSQKPSRGHNTRGHQHSLLSPEQRSQRLSQIKQKRKSERATRLSRVRGQPTQPITVPDIAEET
eukprot:TRINITY_DN12185_c0_g1_i1.p1 TRINITY_DN12185_c0_g1~~TRINITY_DN12185_c0_g1_i1.p1  ORF type:complete len:274 (+),score=40.72 TRINITY_DN12185_c0_g1_i1:86-907(+)